MSEEDLAGHPFVGPAGRELDRALEQAGIDREQVSVTNAVKHFEFEERGKRRIHKKPSKGEIDARGRRYRRRWSTATRIAARTTTPIPMSPIVSTRSSIRGPRK
jgi:uracil-DNA glycosylase